MRRSGETRVTAEGVEFQGIGEKVQGAARRVPSWSRWGIGSIEDREASSADSEHGSVLQGRLLRPFESQTDLTNTAQHDSVLIGLARHRLSASTRYGR